MAQTSKHCVDAAIAFANNEQHSGNGYQLRITLESGAVLEGVVSRMDGQHPEVLFLLIEDTSTSRHSEVFVEKHRVVTAAIIW